MKNIFIYILIIAVVVLAGVLAWQFWSQSAFLLEWSCGDDLSYKGRDYNTVQIGNQCWFAKNLDYDNGCSDINWVDFSDEGWCGYYNETDYGEGLLYQWSAAMNGVTTEGAQGLCPDGWHIPSDSEWTILKDNLCGDRGDEGSAMAGHTDLWKLGHADQFWVHGGIESDDDFGCSNFGVLPTGFRSPDGRYIFRSVSATLWSSTGGDTSAWGRYLNCYGSGVDRDVDTKVEGFSVRCIRN